VHYPTDVLTGVAVGTVVARSVAAVNAAAVKETEL
jgi:membrane-associated phospholipid phosphatase